MAKDQKLERKGRKVNEHQDFLGDLRFFFASFALKGLGL